MKKFIQLLFLLFIFSGFSQKRLTILNYASGSHKVYKIYSKPTTGTYPFCYNNGSALGFNPNETTYFINLSSVTKFPFATTGPVSLNGQITTWNRQTSATAFLNLTSNNLWNSVTSNSQVFSYVTVDGVTINNKIGATFPNPIIIGTATNGGWQVIYERIEYNPGNYEDFIIFTDL